ncbi:hypothetical protein RRG08_043537 [Elysia crispata]|uniref:Uncharacterized protein n=1 Tax=Elysia crispata TaxID=231223 RepID=A0AAE1CXW8_9GAST|nr:hypothetical protein RRG08_043537 [Elysia crispata]
MTAGCLARQEGSVRRTMTRDDQLIALSSSGSQISLPWSTLRGSDMGNEINGGGLSRPLQGVPMVATSPVRHEPGVNMQGQPVEVQSYQTPWKALSEFALQGDMDQPHAPFQQLMSSFDHMDPGLPSPPPHGHPEMLLHHHPSPAHHPENMMMMHRGYMHSDDMVGSVGSDFSGTPSELSHSPISH